MYRPYLSTELDRRDFAVYDPVLPAHRGGGARWTRNVRGRDPALGVEITIVHGLTEPPVTHQTLCPSIPKKRHSTVGRPIEHTRRAKSH